MIEVIGLSTRLGDREVLKDINLRVEKGSIFGLIGPNGAGKTTLIKLLSGIWRQDSGSVRIMGEEVFNNREVKGRIAYVADQSNHYNSFKVRDMMKFYMLTYSHFDSEKFEKLSKRFDIHPNILVGQLSKGMKMRLSMILSLSVMPEVLILDEPTSGLDAMAKRDFVNLLLEDAAERGTTIFISSHNLNDLERICDTIGMIEGGRLKSISSMDSMKASIRKLQVVFRNGEPGGLEGWTGIMKVMRVGRVCYIITNENPGEIIERLQKHGADFVEELDLSLEDMFIYSIGEDVNHEEIL